MSVAPDPLLRSAPEIKSKASAGKAPAKAPEPRKSEVASFAQVYAKERQAKAAARSEAPAKPGHEARAKPQEAQADTAAEQPALADSGKPLPSDPLLDQAALDPLLLMGPASQPPLDAEAPELDLEGLVLEGGAALPATSAGSLLGPGPASLSEASLEPELDALKQLPAVHMALELAAKTKTTAAEQGAPGMQAAQAAVGGGQGFAGSLLAMGLQQAQGDAGERAEVPLIELTAQGLEALKESVADNRPENFVGKLNALSQASAQQTPQAPRAVMIPGQPVPMQQGGWGEEVVDRVMWLSSQNLKSAEIQLDPAELGRLEVRISLAQEQTQVTFASANAGVREALEGQLHRLRELFTQQGMNLLDVNVSDQSLSRGGQGQEGDGRGRGAAGRALLGSSEEGGAAGNVEPRSSPLSVGRGMVDYYA